MSAAPPPSIGDGDKAEYVLSREEHILPKTRKEVVARIETLLGQGGVQKLIVEVGRPMQLFRLVHKDEYTSPPPELPADDVWNQLRNGKLEDLDAKSSLSPHQLLFFAFDQVVKLRLKPLQFFIADEKLVRRWLKLEENYALRQMFGVDVSMVKEVPRDCVVLAAGSHDALNPDVYGVRIPVDLPKKETA